MTLGELNALPPDAARAELLRCCGSHRWAAAMADRRPFTSREQLHRVADEVWQSLTETDWLEAFSHHPRIGERAAGWAASEQSGASNASADVRAALAARNHDYERRFGFVFLICATGRSADEMLDTLERRLANDAATELRAAAQEQAKITRLRLDKLLDAPVDRGRERSGVKATNR